MNHFSQGQVLTATDLNQMVGAINDRVTKEEATNFAKKDSETLTNPSIGSAEITDSVINGSIIRSSVILDSVVLKNSENDNSFTLTVTANGREIQPMQDGTQKFIISNSGKTTCDQKSITVKSNDATLIASVNMTNYLVSSGEAYYELNIEGVYFPVRGVNYKLDGDDIGDKPFELKKTDGYFILKTYDRIIKKWSEFKKVSLSYKFVSLRAITRGSILVYDRYFEQKTYLLSDSISINLEDFCHP